jgi:uncharacterized protein YjdB
MTRGWVVNAGTFAVRSAAAVAIVTSAACADSQPSPTSPGRIEPTQTTTVAEVRGVAIEPGTSILKLGQVQQFAAMLELGPGAVPVGPVPLWTSSDHAVVAVAHGKVTAVGVGEATVEVSVHGRTATRRFQVVR